MVAPPTTTLGERAAALKNSFMAERSPLPTTSVFLLKCYEKVRSLMDWRHQSRCRDVDPELFFPIGTTGPAEAQVEAAKAICTLCPVREPCLQWALDTAQDAGVWGGLSEEERRALRRGQRRKIRIA